MFTIVFNALLQLLLAMMDERRTSFYGTTPGHLQNQMLFSNNVLPTSNLVSGTSLLGQGPLEEILKKLTEQQQMLSSAASDNKELKDSVASLKNEITGIKNEIAIVKDGIKSSFEDTKKKPKLPKPLLVSCQYLCNFISKGYV